MSAYSIKRPYRYGDVLMVNEDRSIFYVVDNIELQVYNVGLFKGELFWMVETVQAWPMKRDEDLSTEEIFMIYFDNEGLTIIHNFKRKEDLRIKVVGHIEDYLKLKDEATN